MLYNGENFYEPSYFFIKIDTNKLPTDLDQLLMDRVFVHEYVHMLQDISLQSTRALMQENVNYFRGLSYEIRENKNVNRPIVNSSLNLKINQETFCKIWGSERNFEKASIVNMEIKKESIAGSYERNFILLELNHSESKINYKIGTRDFLETMAYCIENHIFGFEDFDDFPYFSIKKILEYKNIFVDNYQLSTICELALNSFDPTQAFIQFLNRYNGLDYVQIYKAMYEGVNYTYQDRDLTKSDADEVVFLESKEMILDWFKSPVFSSIKTWVNEILDLGSNYRKENLTFISNILLGDRDNSISKIRNYVLKTGVPIIYNSNFEMIVIDSLNTKADTFYLKALKELNSYLRETRIHCNLLSFCKKSKNVTVDDNCVSDIPAKINDEKLCPLSAWIKTFGFQSVS